MLYKGLIGEKNPMSKMVAEKIKILEGRVNEKMGLIYA